MLRRFVYLDKVALAQYVGALEGGLLTESTLRSLNSGTGNGEINARIARVGGEKSREEETARTLADTDEARFGRLLRAAELQPDALAWLDVTAPDLDFDGIGIGTMVHWECDIFVPTIIQTLARSGEAVEALGMMQSLLPMAKTLGLDTEGLPDAGEMDAVAGFIGNLNAKLLVVGEDDDTDWRIAGKLDGEVDGDLDGRARVVGKVSKVMADGEWKPYVTFPGMNLLSREERRRLAAQRPEEGKEDEYLPGPALLLDILAVYR